MIIPIVAGNIVTHHFGQGIRRFLCHHPGTVFVQPHLHRQPHRGCDALDHVRFDRYPAVGNGADHRQILQRIRQGSVLSHPRPGTINFPDVPQIQGAFFGRNAIQTKRLVEAHFFRGFR